MPEIKATVTKTVEVKMLPLYAFLYFDEAGSDENGRPIRVRRVAIQYGEYHDGVLHRPLAMQDAPADKAGPVLDAVYGAMMGAAAEALASALAKAPEERDANEAYLAALMEAGAK